MRHCFLPVLAVVGLLAGCGGGGGTGGIAATPGPVSSNSAGPGPTPTPTSGPGLPTRDHPVITGISPDHGSAAGGTLVTINGSGFLHRNSLIVTFGSAGDAIDVHVLDDNTITCVTRAVSDLSIFNPAIMGSHVGLVGFQIITYENDKEVLTFSSVHYTFVQ